MKGIMGKSYYIKIKNAPQKKSKKASHKLYIALSIRIYKEFQVNKKKTTQ